MTTSGQDANRFTATVKQALPNGVFRVALDDGHQVIAHVPGRSRTQFSRILPGDRVTVETSPYDRSKGRIEGFGL